MTTLRKTVSLLAITASATLGLTIVNHASPAHAALSQCTSSHACGWNFDNYANQWVSAVGDIPSLGMVSWNSEPGVTPNNKINSVANNGNSCRAVFYENNFNGGKAIVFNNPARGGTTRDPNLANGGGYKFQGTGKVNNEDWRNRISGIGWDC